MPSYPCPPVGFQFTEENIHKAKAFYALWLLHVGLANCEVLTNTAIPYDGGFLSNSLGNLSGGVSISQCEKHLMLPWVVLSHGEPLHYTFTETPLPEGEIECLTK